MIKNPLVSIVVANYNSENYLNATLNSLYLQTYKNLEIILIDDCSTDSSVDIINDWISAGMKNMKFIQNERNLGGGMTKLKGLELSNGEIVGFVDCDDYLHESAVEKMVDAHTQLDNVGLIYSNAFQIDSEGRYSGLLNKAGKLEEGESILERDCAFHFATWKTRYYKLCESGFSGKFNIAYDLDLYYKLEEVSDVYYLDEPLYFYRVHDNNLSIGLNKMGLSMSELIIAKFEAQCRREKINLKELGIVLQSTYNKVYNKGIKSVGLKKLLISKLKKLL